MKQLTNLWENISNYDSAKLIALGCGLTFFGFGALIAAMLAFITTGDASQAFYLVLTITVPFVAIAHVLLPIARRIKKLENTPF